MGQKCPKVCLLPSLTKSLLLLFVALDGTEVVTMLKSKLTLLGLWLLLLWKDAKLVKSLLKFTFFLEFFCLQFLFIVDFNLFIYFFIGVVIFY